MKRRCAAMLKDQGDAIIVLKKANTNVAFMDRGVFGTVYCHKGVA